ncbi:hypothetical protein CO024_02320, partial [Candidatus Gracilibacteria bacterium CG_4_9_14_0_2_um_filter_38_7]
VNKIIANKSRLFFESLKKKRNNRLRKKGRNKPVIRVKEANPKENPAKKVNFKSLFLKAKK